MNRIRTSFAIIAQSLALISRHPKLVLFPVVNLAGLVFLFAFFCLPVFFETTVFTMEDEWAAFREMMQERGEENRVVREAGDSVFDDRAQSAPVTIGRVTFTGSGGVVFPLLPLAFYYLLFMVVMTWVNVAYYYEILQAYSGNPIVLARGFAFASRKWRAILAWSLLAGFVGLLIRKIEENVGFVGRWITGLVGFTWSVASVFAIPVIIREEQQSNPVAYLKTSAGIIKRTWGEGLAGIVSISVVIVLAIIAYTVLSFMVMFVLPETAILYVIIGIFVVIFILGYLSMMMKDLFLCGLYVYATEGVVPGPYDPELMEHAWRVKKK